MQALFRGEHPFDFTGEQRVPLARPLDECPPLVRRALERQLEDLEMAVKVSPEILARYVGTYDFRIPENPATPVLFSLTLDGDRLLIGGAPVIPLSETTFGGPFGRFEVVRDTRGEVTHLLVRVAEGEVKAVRRPD